MSDARTLPVNLLVERVDTLSERDLEELCDAAEEAIVDGGGFGWLTPPPRGKMERYWHGVVAMPLRTLFVARLDTEIVGTAQLVRPPSNAEAQAVIAGLATAFVRPRARGHGLAAKLIRAVEDQARTDGFRLLQLDVRTTQTRAIQLYEQLGFERWATQRRYAFVGGAWIAGHHYEKLLAPDPT